MVSDVCCVDLDGTLESLLQPLDPVLVNCTSHPRQLGLALRVPLSRVRSVSRAVGGSARSASCPQLHGSAVWTGGCACTVSSGEEIVIVYFLLTKLSGKYSILIC